MAPRTDKNILDRIAEAVHSISADVRVHMKDHPDFADIGGSMLREWKKVSIDYRAYRYDFTGTIVGIY